MNNAIKNQLARMDVLSDEQLVRIVELLPDDPAPDNVKLLIIGKVADILRARMAGDVYVE